MPSPKCPPTSHTAKILLRVPGYFLAVWGVLFGFSNLLFTRAKKNKGTAYPAGRVWVLESAYQLDMTLDNLLFLLEPRFPHI